MITEGMWLWMGIIFEIIHVPWSLFILLVQDNDIATVVIFRKSLNNMLIGVYREHASLDLLDSKFTLCFDRLNSNTFHWNNTQKK
ncbi:MAG: hypothetical protein ACXAC8_16265 [Candidatus Hodarchaeales archaeon]